MTKRDFLNELRKTLSGAMNSEEINAHAVYYSEYIEMEARKCGDEEAVVEMLGSPALLAKSLIQAKECADGVKNGRTPEYGAGRWGRSALRERLLWGLQKIKNLLGELRSGK